MRNRKFFRHLLTTPFIWSLLIPIVLFHFFLFVYQAVSFRVYGMERVRLRSYINFERGKLAYLSLFDKFNCAYCGYANGFLAYAVEIGHRTEYYWCGVKHRNQPDNPAFAYQAKFAAYGSEEEYDQVRIKTGRRSLK